jgi:hypothetical protein
MNDKDSDGRDLIVCSQCHNDKFAMYGGIAKNGKSFSLVAICLDCGHQVTVISGKAKGKRRPRGLI